MKKLILFAHISEAKSLLKELNPKKINDSLYHYSQGFIAISGVGVIPAMATVAKLAPHIDEIYNIGFAGALYQGAKMGEIFPISLVGKFSPSPLLSQQDLCLESQGARLVTADFPLHDASYKTLLCPRYELVDMEGFGIAYLAKALGKKCSLWKIVSDFSQRGGSQLIAQHKEELSSLIASWSLQTIG